MSETVPDAVGVIGAGRMGLPMAGHMVDAGFDVVVFDTDIGAMEAAEARGCRQAPSPMSLAALTGTILVLVPDDRATRMVCAGDNGVLRAAHPGAVIVVSASLLPDTVRDLEKTAAAKGVGLLDVPLTKGERAAVAGDMTLLVGGDAGHLAGVRPVLESFSTSIHHVGPVGAGQIAKTVNNLLLWANMTAAVEALRFGAHLGLDPATLRDAMFDCSADSWVLRELTRIKPTWPRKDLDNALAMAKAAGTSLPLIERVSDLIDAIDQEKINILLGE